MSSQEFVQALNLKYPLIVAPMAGGPSSVELVVASSEAGALGSIGAAYSSPKAIEDFVAQVRAKTAKPILINLFVPHPQPDVSQAQLNRAIEATAIYRQKFSLPVPILVPPYEESFDQQFEAVLKTRPEVFSFVFGVLKSEYLRAAKKEKIFVVGSATSLDEALELVESGVDAIALQGIEAGGHRGIFNPSAADPEVTILNLLEQCKSKIKIPLLAAGGIMNAQDVKLMLSKGASAVQMGTAFLACQEAGTSAPYRRVMLASDKRNTKTTRAFSGRLARGVVNTFMQDMERTPEAILPFQAQNKFTRDIRGASLKADSSECLSLWSGTGDGSLWTGRTSGLIEMLFYSQKPL